MSSGAALHRRVATRMPEPISLAAENKSIKVAFVDQSGSSAGGAERTLATYLKFAPPDLDPGVILFEDGAFAQELRELAVPVRVIAAPESIRSAKRERLPLRAAFDIVGHGARVARCLRDFRVDVVYSNTMKSHFVCAVAARLAGIPCVMHFHDLLDGATLHAVRFVARMGSAERVACAGIVARSIGLPRMSVSYGPIDLEDYQGLPRRAEARRSLGLPLDVPVVALIGRINRWKGHDRFLQIAALVKQKTHVHFAIVGSAMFRDSDFVPELHALMQELGLTNDVSFIPWVEDVRSVYAAIDLNVNCSTREPFGRSVVEAAAAGVPSVFFNDSGAAETILDGRTGRVVAAGDERAFASAIVDTLRMTSDERFRAYVRTSALRFDASAMTEEVATVIRRVAKVSPGVADVR
jgi:glycosyltransferase involved in cell wall biosynthesis